MERNELYFVSDVHLGLQLCDPADRELRFVKFLRSIPRERTKALYMLGDIWDFWYEYRDVIPNYGTRVIAALVNLMDDGVEVWFCPGNHDIWTYNYFESIGMHRFEQPYYFTDSGKTFCVGHGDTLGGAKWSYRFMLSVFRCRFLQRLFSMLHPWIAYRIGFSWSNSNRRSHKPYHFRGDDEPLYKFAVASSKQRHADYYIFGHFHDAVNMELPDSSRLIVLKDWMDGLMPHAVFNGSCLQVHSQACDVQ